MSDKVYIRQPENLDEVSLSRVTEFLTVDERGLIVKLKAEDLVITGPRGPEGPQGPEGPRGQPGPRGDEGLRGEPGIQGEKGDPGDPGPQGPQGPQGDRGEPGVMGPPGPQGPAGPRGDRGGIGPQGPQGEIGPQGPRGPQGEMGPRGPQGDPGPRGERGETGRPGQDGLPGPKGEHGLDGEDGKSAYQIALDNGFEGGEAEWLHSLRGERGERGPQGIEGAQGIEGRPGRDGRDGVDGLDGPEGPQGPRGPRGYQGERGPQGDMGPKGDVGPEGRQGPQGPEGPKGSPGIQGIQGPIGPEGPQGERGPRGEKGERGPEGPMGPQGPQGLAGARGPQGDPGERGPQGIRGDEGPRGERGPQGIQGLPGERGQDGAPGKSVYELAVEGGYEGTEEDLSSLLNDLMGVTYIDSIRDIPEGNAWLIFNRDLFIGDTEYKENQVVLSQGGRLYPLGGGMGGGLDIFEWYNVITPGEEVYEHPLYTDFADTTIGNASSFEDSSLIDGFTLTSSSTEPRTEPMEVIQALGHEVPVAMNPDTYAYITLRGDVDYPYGMGAVNFVPGLVIHRKNNTKVICTIGTNTSPDALSELLGGHDEVTFLLAIEGGQYFVVGINLGGPDGVITVPLDVAEVENMVSIGFPMFEPGDRIQWVASMVAMVDPNIVMSDYSITFDYSISDALQFSIDGATPEELEVVEFKGVESSYTLPDTHTREPLPDEDSIIRVMFDDDEYSLDDILLYTSGNLLPMGGGGLRLIEFNPNDHLVVNYPAMVPYTTTILSNDIGRDFNVEGNTHTTFMEGGVGDEMSFYGNMEIMSLDVGVKASFFMFFIKVEDIVVDPIDGYINNPMLRISLVDETEPLTYLLSGIEIDLLTGESYHYDQGTFTVDLSNMMILVEIRSTGSAIYVLDESGVKGIRTFNNTTNIPSAGFKPTVSITPGIVSTSGNSVVTGDTGATVTLHADVRDPIYTQMGLNLPAPLKSSMVGLPDNLKPGDVLEFTHGASISGRRINPGDNLVITRSSPLKYFRVPGITGGGGVVTVNIPGDYPDLNTAYNDLITIGDIESRGAIVRVNGTVQDSELSLAPKHNDLTWLSIHAGEYAAIEVTSSNAHVFSGIGMMGVKLGGFLGEWRIVNHSNIPDPSFSLFNETLSVTGSNSTSSPVLTLIIDSPDITLDLRMPNVIEDNHYPIKISKGDSVVEIMKPTITLNKQNNALIFDKINTEVNLRSRYEGMGNGVVWIDGGNDHEYEPMFDVEGVNGIIYLDSNNQRFVNIRNCSDLILEHRRTTPFHPLPPQQTLEISNSNVTIKSGYIRGILGGNVGIDAVVTMNSKISLNRSELTIMGIPYISGMNELEDVITLNDNSNLRLGFIRSSASSPNNLKRTFVKVDNSYLHEWDSGTPGSSYDITGVTFID